MGEGNRPVGNKSGNNAGSIKDNLLTDMWYAI